MEASSTGLSGKVTVVVPCYNVENYLARCLDSLITQTYKNIEVVMVEDCSTDDTKKIVQQYEKKYPNFRAIYNKKNGGLGNARNVGIAATASDYITFLDSDDWLPENYITEMHKTLVEKNADVAICDFFLRYDDAERDLRVIAYTGKPNKLGLINTGMAASSSNKLFKTELFNDLKYPVGIVNEDIPVVLAIINRAKVAYTPDTHFNYYQRLGSIQNGTITLKRLDVFSSVELLKENLGGRVDGKIWQAVVWHQIIAIFIYVLPKARGILHRKNLIEKFSELAYEQQIDIANNFGFKQFLENSKADKIYGNLAVRLITNDQYLLCSVLMGVYRFYISSRVLKKLVFAVQHPLQFLRQIVSRIVHLIKHKNVIKTKATMEHLIVAAKKQQKLSSATPVSVIIPNYNYEKYLIERLHCILHQTAKIGEVIILDDNSSDNSVVLANKIKQALHKYVPIRTINNKVNQGTFRQWERGFEEAKCSFVWIAEADDYSDKRFVENALKPFIKNENVVISYVNTGYINEKGLLLGNVKQDIDYQKSGHWDKSYIQTGYDEARTFSYVNNTIANVSSVVFRKKPDINYKDLFADTLKYRQVGDWVFYVNYMLHGDIAYTDKILNYYRLHGNNVSSTMKARDHINEILEVQDMFVRKLGLKSDEKKKMADRIKFLKKAWKV